MTKEAPLLSTLVQRLRGIYVLGVNDGAGLLDGKDTFTRNFGTTPIKEEAALRIEQLEEFIRQLGYPLEGVAYEPKPNDGRFPYTYACDQIRKWGGREVGEEGLGGVSYTSPNLSRADASRLYSKFAQALGLNERWVAEKIAESYLADEAEENKSS